MSSDVYESSSSSMAILSPRGQATKISFKRLPENFILDPGYTLSWECLFARTNLPFGFIRSGHATISIETLPGTQLIRIESPDPKDFDRAIEKLYLLIGGKISTFGVAPSTDQSFIGGVSNDIKRLREWLRHSFRSVRNNLAMRFVG